MEELNGVPESSTTSEEKVLPKENTKLIAADEDNIKLAFLDDTFMFFDNIFKCLRCELTFKSQNELHNCTPLPMNMNKQKKLKRVFQCTLCNKHYLFPSLATLHIKRHEKYMNVKVVIKCYVCDSKFLTTKELKDHSEKEHNIIQYLCIICNKLFKHSRNLQNHIFTHSGDKPYQCELCGNKFSRADHLTRHRKNNCDQLEFECDLCGKIYKTKRGSVL